MRSRRRSVSSWISFMADSVKPWSAAALRRFGKDLSYYCGREWCVWQSGGGPPHSTEISLAFPAHSVFRIFENDSTICERDSNLVSSSEITTTSRFLPFVDQCLHLGIEHFSFLITEDIEHSIELSKQFE